MGTSSSSAPPEGFRMAFAERERDFYSGRVSQARQRALVILTTSGTFATVLTGGAAILPDAQGVDVPTLGIYLILASIVLFAASAMFASIESGPVRSNEDHPFDPPRSVNSLTTDKAEETLANHTVALKNLANGVANDVHIAIWVQAGAIVSLALAAFLTVESVL